jgi:hypothetical protein
MHYVFQLLLATKFKGKNIMYATFDSIKVPALSKDVQDFTLNSYIYGRAFTKAFSITIAPRLIIAGKTFLHYSLIGLNTLEQQELEAIELQYNPVRAAAKAAWTELHSPDAIACYRQMHSVYNARQTEAKEKLFDIAIVGLCGVIAISEGIEFAQRVYQSAKSLYARVEALFNPPAPGPVELLTVKLAMITKSNAEIELIAEQLQQERQTIAQFDVAEADALSQVEAKVDEAIVQVNIQSVKDARAALALAKESDRHAQAQLEFVTDKAVVFAQEKLNQPNASSNYVPVTGQIWNPESKDVHQEVAQMATAKIPAAVEETIASALHVPGAVAERKRRKPISNSTTNKRRSTQKS